MGNMPLCMKEETLDKTSTGGGKHGEERQGKI